MDTTNKSIKFIYPKLPSKGGTTTFVRFSGSGLANCLFVYARAIKLAQETGCKLITPTWFNLSIGPYLRHQSDKRHYLGLFSDEGEIRGLNKLFKLYWNKNQIVVVEGLGLYFAELLDSASVIKKYIEAQVVPKQLYSVNKYDFTNCVAVHIRLGDYPEHVRVPIHWYKKKIDSLQVEHPEYRFIIFSDGKDDELAELTSMKNVKREFFGNAIADIFAISRCCYMIGSDSTFSGWGAFLGQVPCVFYRKHYGSVLADSSKEIVENNEVLW